MKGIKVTQDNFKMIYGRVFKFFLPNGKNKTTAMAFDIWADTKIRRNNHVRVTGNVTHAFVNKIVGYHDEDGIPMAIGIHITDIMMGQRDIYIATGNKVAFCGNRIVLKLLFKDDMDNVQTGYMVIQVSNAITEEELQALRASVPVMDTTTDFSFVDENDSIDEADDNCNCGCDHTCG